MLSLFMYHNDNKLSITGQENAVKSITFNSSLDSIDISNTKSHPVITLYCQKCGYSYKTSPKCGDRTCVICRQKDYDRLIFTYRQFLSSRHSLRLLTLTLRGRQNILPRQRISRIRKYFKALYRIPYYQTHLSGGFYSIESKKKDVGWNIHIHILYQGGFIAQSRLKSDWYKITGDSYIVDIRKAYSSLGGFKYILKYLTKSPEAKSYEDIWQYNNAFRGVRLLSAFGSWYKQSKPIKEKYICPLCQSSDWLSEYDILKYAIRADLSPPVVSIIGLNQSHDPLI